MQPAIHSFGKIQKLWIIQTDRGTKRTWKPTQDDARHAVKRAGYQIVSLRRGTPRDLSVARCRSCDSLLAF